MNFYSFHIGDYQSHTAHLSPIADIAYRRMLDWCYLHERALPREIKIIAKFIRMPEHEQIIEQICREFFVSTRTGWLNKRTNFELNFYHQKSAKASSSAKLRWHKEKIDANALQTLCERNATNTITNTITKEENIDTYVSQSKLKVPTCPQQQILQLYAKHLPHLTQPRVWQGSRAAKLKQRWIQASQPSEYSENGYSTKENGLKWWDSFFEYIANKTKLSHGFESNGKIWKPDLEWIVSATNFAKIIDGKYNK